ncbi:MAG: hypothetical protein RLZZ562_1414, partial [Planctomycetota bacterium]
MIPLRDDNPTTTKPVVTFVVIAICVGVYLLQSAGQGAVDDVTSGLSMVPARVSGESDVVMKMPLGMGRTARVELPPAWVPEWLTLLTCTFLHGSWLHLLGNLWILWIFG